MALSGIREKMNQNQKPFIIGGIVIVCLAIALVIWELKPVSAPPPPSSAYFYDTSNGSIVVKPANSIPPLKGANGKDTLVLAKFFTCTTCGDKKIGYLLKYTSQGRSAIKVLADAPTALSPKEKIVAFATQESGEKMAVAEGTLVRLPAKGSHWVSAMSFRGIQLIRQAKSCPGNQFAKPCSP
jgi:hypothetical protein